MTGGRDDGKFRGVGVMGDLRQRGNIWIDLLKIREGMSGVYHRAKPEVSGSCVNLRLL